MSTGRVMRALRTFRAYSGNGGRPVFMGTLTAQGWCQRFCRFGIDCGRGSAPAVSWIVTQGIRTALIEPGSSTSFEKDKIRKRHPLCTKIIHYPLHQNNTLCPINIQVSESNPRPTRTLEGCVHPRFRACGILSARAPPHRLTSLSGRSPWLRLTGIIPYHHRRGQSDGATSKSPSCFICPSYIRRTARCRTAFRLRPCDSGFSPSWRTRTRN